MPHRGEIPPPVGKRLIVVAAMSVASVVLVAALAAIVSISGGGMTDGEAFAMGFLTAALVALIAAVSAR